MREAIKRFGEAYENRKKISELGAFWYTEIGPLNQLVYVWTYKDLADRARARAAASKDPNWPPRLAQFSAAQRSDIFIAVAGSPELKKGKVGPVFEMRTYALAPGELPLVLENWQTALPGRNALKPACAVWYSDVGALNKLVHIWPYESFEQREEIRKKAFETGNWPPHVMAKKEGRPPCAYVAQDTKFLVAAEFSPIQ